jgi:hypothetical protein
MRRLNITTYDQLNSLIRDISHRWCYMCGKYTHHLWCGFEWNNGRWECLRCEEEVEMLDKISIIFNVEQELHGELRGDIE